MYIPAQVANAPAPAVSIALPAMMADGRGIEGSGMLAITARQLQWRKTNNLYYDNSLYPPYIYAINFLEILQDMLPSYTTQGVEWSETRKKDI